MDTSVDTSVDTSADKHIKNVTKKSTWTKDATSAMLRLHFDMKWKSDSAHHKNRSVWEEMTVKLGEEGFHFSMEQVEGRWKTFLPAYRRVMDHNNKTGNDREDFRYLNEMKQILGNNPTIQPQCTISSAEGLKGHNSTIKRPNRDDGSRPNKRAMQKGELVGWLEN